jgi:hypothetical protein
MSIILIMIKRFIKKNLINIFKISYKILNIISIIYFLFNIIELIKINDGININEKYKGNCIINLPMIIDLIDEQYYYKIKCNFILENIINQTCYLSNIPSIYFTKILNQGKHNCFLCNKNVVKNTNQTIPIVSIQDCNLYYNLIFYILIYIFIPSIIKLCITIYYKKIINKIILKSMIIDQYIYIEENINCMICLKILYNENAFILSDTKIIKTSCFIPHYYCYECLEKWINYNNKCPYCKTKIVL